MLRPHHDEQARESKIPYYFLIGVLILAIGAALWNIWNNGGYIKAWFL